MNGSNQTKIKQLMFNVINSLKFFLSLGIQCHNQSIFSIMRPHEKLDFVSYLVPWFTIESRDGNEFN